MATGVIKKISDEFIDSNIESGTSNIITIPFSSLPSVTSGYGTIELAIASYNGGAYNYCLGKFILLISNSTPYKIIELFAADNMTGIIDSTNSQIKIQGAGWYCHAFYKVYRRYHY